MHLVNIHEAKPQLPKLMEQVQVGAPIVRLVPYAPPGAMEGEVWISDDFDEPLDELFDCLKDDAK